MKKNKNKLIKFSISTIPLIAFLLASWFVILSVKSFIIEGSYFKIKKIVLNGIQDKEIAQEISRDFLYDNIFSLDIKKIKEDLKTAYPQFYDIEVVKNFPDQLTINIILRRPVAQINGRGFFLIDSEGMIISDTSGSPFGNFIIITGLKGISNLSFGKKIRTQQLVSGLRLANLLQNIKHQISFAQGLKNEKIRVDLSNYPSLYAYLDKLELRFYDENFDKSIQSLMRILVSINKKIDKIKYIDLRFIEPAIYFKDEKKNTL